MNTYIIRTDHDVYIDSYKHGELNHVNSYTQEAKINATTTREATDKYIKDYLGFTPPEDYQDLIDPNQPHRLHYSELVDIDNTQLTQTELEEWKNGNFTAYNNTYTLSAYILKEATC